MARSAEQRHRILWSELVGQLVCREDVHVEGGESGTTGYVDRKPGRFDVPTGRITVVRDGKKGQVLLLPDRLEVDWATGPSRSVPLDLSNAYRAELPNAPENSPEVGPAASPAHRTYPSAREAAEDLVARLLP